MLRPRDFRQGRWRWISCHCRTPPSFGRRVVGFVTLEKYSLNSGRADRTVCKRNQLIPLGSGRSAGIAKFLGSMNGTRLGCLSCVLQLFLWVGTSCTGKPATVVFC